MKILYGVQGTGNGHISRARMMAKHFKEAFASSQLEVTFLFSGRDPDLFFDMTCFGDYQYRRGFTFISRSGSVQMMETALKNNLFIFLKDIATLEISQYDLIITDFEPITAWAGKLAGKKVIGLGHQYAFNHDIPTAGGNWLANKIMQYFAPVDIGIGLHWHHFNHNILPPIIDNHLQREECSGKVLVYLPFESQLAVTELLNTFSDESFIQYSQELSDQQCGNVSLRRTSHTGFKQDLAQCKAVICNTGFELISECLNLGVPILTRPLKGQMEQLSNAEALKQLGYADIMQDLDQKKIAQWLQQRKHPEKIIFPNVAKAIVDWLTTTNIDNPETMFEQLWHPSSQLILSNSPQLTGKP